jgi:hypothetical protein
VKLCDLDQRVIVPVVDESRGGMRYELEMSVGELLGKVLEDFEPAVMDAVPVVHGRWGENGDCSDCGFRPWYERDIHTLSYCPNCGAKMDGDQEARA